MSNKKKILAIDDESDLLLILKTALFAEGFEVLTATNGPDGLALAGDHVPDLIILDMMMPEMDGFEVLKELRASDTTARIPVIMLTGVSERAKIRSALDQGIDYYVIKPFEFHDLMSKIKIAMADAEPPGL
ncbi:MAG: response regulator [Candidatus Sumerlaeaceae bacterium]|nr:response regulator [Candidatus Sumerlaeaceae bacterium]